MEIIAHRGASHAAPENTLASVRLGWEEKADAVEVDVHLTSDREIVVIHDEDTRRTTGLRKPVLAQTLAELQRLDAGSWKGPQWKQEHIPTLAQVIETIPDGKRLFIEVKCGRGFLDSFEPLLERYAPRSKSLILIGFELPLMQTVKAKWPALEVCWISEFKRSLKTARWTPKPAELIQRARDASLDGLDMGRRGPVNREFVEAVHAAGLRFYVWTVDSEETARTLIEAGVDGITTNRPGWLRAHLGL